MPEPIDKEEVLHGVRRLRQDRRGERTGPTTARLVKFLRRGKPQVEKALDELMADGAIEKRDGTWWIVEQES